MVKTEKLEAFEHGQVIIKQDAETLPNARCSIGGSMLQSQRLTRVGVSWRAKHVR